MARFHGMKQFCSCLLTVFAKFLLIFADFRCSFIHSFAWQTSRDINGQWHTENLTFSLFVDANADIVAVVVVVIAVSFGLE